mgnify:CR=1 FL=1
MGTPWTNEQLEEIYQKAHQTSIMSQLDELEMSIKAAKLYDQHHIVVNNRYDFEVILKLEEREYVVDHNNDYYPFIYTISWK